MEHTLIKTCKHLLWLKDSGRSHKFLNTSRLMEKTNTARSEIKSKMFCPRWLLRPFSWNSRLVIRIFSTFFVPAVYGDILMQCHIIIVLIQRGFVTLKRFRHLFFSCTSPFDSLILSSKVAFEEIDQSNNLVNLFL